MFVDRQTVALIQGITGKEGRKAAVSMREYGTTVAAGVTPGKGGQVVDGWPVYDTVNEAVQHHPDINATVLYVPAAAVFDAALEAIEAGIRLVTIVTEQV